MINLKRRIKKGEILIGTWLNTGSPIVAEITARTGLDFIVIDLEHAAIDIAQIIPLLQAIKTGNSKCATLVRMPGNKYEDTKRYLDTGIEGVIAPLIKSRQDAEMLVSSAKYPPIGKRGVGFSRAHGYGANFEGYMKTANKKTFLCVQIEDIEAIRSIDEILSTPHIDAAFIGPYDLSSSMGITGKFTHPQYIKVERVFLDACRKNTVIPGIHVVQPDIEEVKRRIREGYQIIAYSLDIVVLDVHYRNSLKKIKSIIG